MPSAAGCSTRILSPDRPAVQQKTLAHNGSRFKSLLKLRGLLANVALIYGPSLRSPWLVVGAMALSNHQHLGGARFGETFSGVITEDQRQWPRAARCARVRGQLLGLSQAK